MITSTDLGKEKEPFTWIALLLERFECVPGSELLLGLPGPL